MSEIKSEADAMDVDVKSEIAEPKKETKITKKSKNYARTYHKLSKKYSKVIEDSEALFINYTDLRKDYISLSKKIGSLTDILGLIDRLHDHQTDMTDEKERIETIISKKPQLKEILNPIIQDDGFKKELEDYFPLTDLSVHLLQDRVEETNPTREIAWLENGTSKTVSSAGSKKRRGSITSEESVKKRKTVD